ncbi:MAG: hypothetical protein Q8J97_07145, partial [Flavobacteriaceae bacterium]|nr:hypothetical protein [Flavobacteriaceae bacterium]
TEKISSRVLIFIFHLIRDFVTYFLVNQDSNAGLVTFFLTGSEFCKMVFLTLTVVPSGFNNISNASSSPNSDLFSFEDATKGIKKALPKMGRKFLRVNFSFFSMTHIIYWM